MSHHLEDNLGDILQKARTGKGLSLSTLSSETGLDEETLNLIEEGGKIQNTNKLNFLPQKLNFQKDVFLMVNYTPQNLEKTKPKISRGL